MVNQEKESQISATPLPNQKNEAVKETDIQKLDKMDMTEMQMNKPPPEVASSFTPKAPITGEMKRNTRTTTVSQKMHPKTTD